MACRRPLPGHAGDEDDIRFLTRKMRIKTVAAVAAIVDTYFPDTVLPASTTLTLEKILAESAP